MSKRKAEWGELVDTVNILAGNSSDIPTYMRSLSVSPEGFLISGRKPVTHWTRQGRASLFERLGIPISFYRKCSDELGREILKEFLLKNASKEVFLRFRQNEDVLRFVGSNKYAPYNDKVMVNELEKHFGTKVLRNVHIDEDHTTFSVLCEDLAFDVGRKFIPGIKVTNSETGCSALTIGFYLHEEVCTNGLVIPRAHFDHYRHVHVFGMRDLKKSPIDEWVVAAWNKMSAVSESCKESAERLRGLPAKAIIEALTKQKTLALSIVESVENALPAYGDTGLDAVSALTQVARDTQVLATKINLEELAGQIMFLPNTLKIAA